LEKNIVKSPLARDMYAFAVSKNGKTRKWFRDKESLRRFLDSVVVGEYRVVMNLQDRD
jgi:hypothetical protein